MGVSVKESVTGGGGGAVGCSLGKIGIQWLSVGKRWMQIVPLGYIVDKSGVQ